ncbi:MFS transporter [Rhodococcus hoagii]|nr:MFS transporter [Prescottella equi]
MNSPTRSVDHSATAAPEGSTGGNSLNMTVMQFGAIAGPLLAGVLIPVAGLSTVYLLDSIALLATLWAVIKLRRCRRPAGAPRRTARGGRGLHVSRHPEGAAGVVRRRHRRVVFGMPRALFPEIAHESFGDPLDGGVALGLLFAAMSAGAVLGGVFSGWLPRIRFQGRAVVICIVLWGLAMVGFGVVIGIAGPDSPAFLLWLALAFLAFGGAVDMVSAALRSTMLQQVATDDMRGRLQGVFTVVVAGGPRIGDVLHGAAAFAFGTAVASAGGGILVVVGVAASILAFPAFMRYRVGRTGRPEHV